MKMKIKYFVASLMVCALLLSSTLALPAFAAENSGSTTASVTRTVPGYYGVTADVLHVRSGPGTNYSIVGYLYYGDAVLVTSISNGWARFLFEGVYRYAKADYLREYKG